MNERREIVRRCINNRRRTAEQTATPSKAPKVPWLKLPVGFRPPAPAVSPRRLPRKSCEPQQQHDRPLRRSFGPFTVILFGASGVGKTSLILRYRCQSAAEVSAPGQTADAVSADANTNKLVFADPDGGGDTEVTLRIMDTSGRDRGLCALPGKFVRSMDAAVLVYAADDQKSLLDLSHWHDLIKQTAPKCVVWYVVANKMDKVESSAAPPAALIDGPDIAGLMGMRNFTCASALTGEHVDFVFSSVARRLVTRQLELMKLEQCSVRSGAASDALQAAAERSIDLAPVSPRPRGRPRRDSCPPAGDGEDKDNDEERARVPLSPRQRELLRRLLLEQRTSLW